MKYGVSNFDFEIVETDIPEDEIDDRERYYIAFYGTYYKDDNGYNMTHGGQGTHGYVFTDADREKINQKQKAYWANIKQNEPEEYARLCALRGKAALGHKVSEEVRQRLRETRKGKAPRNKGMKSPKKPKTKTADVKTPRPKSAKTPWLKQAKNTKQSVAIQGETDYVCAYELTTGRLTSYFASIDVAVDWVIEKSESKNVNQKAMYSRIYIVCTNNTGHAYNYIWANAQNSARAAAGSRGKAREPYPEVKTSPAIYKRRRHRGRVRKRRCLFQDQKCGA